MARRRAENAISFFAFQDVMMSVCGIVVLVALLLVLKLVMQMASAEAAVPAGMTRQEFEAMQAQVGGLVDTRREVQDQTTRLRTQRAAHPGTPWIPSQEQIDAAARGVTQAQSENDSLGSAISSAEEKKGALVNSPASALVRDAEGRIVDLQTTRDDLKKMQAEIATELTKSLKKKGELETQSRALDGQLAQASRDNVSLVVRQSTDKKPIVVVYDARGVTAMSFTEPNKSFDSERTFLDWAKSRNARDEYFVVYLRPSRLNFHKPFIKSLQDMQFDVGFELTGEKTSLAIEVKKP